MKPALIVLLIGLANSSAWALLGDSRDQAESRYGLEKREGVEAAKQPILQGAKEITFEYGGWTIRCALFKGKDGNDYVVREEYRKTWNQKVIKAGGSPNIRESDRTAVIDSEGGNVWTKRAPAELVNTPLAATLDPYFKICGKPQILWTREDGAVVRGDAAGTWMIFDLPLVVKYEVDVKAAAARKDDAKRMAEAMPALPNRPKPGSASTPALVFHAPATTVPAPRAAATAQVTAPGGTSVAAARPTASSAPIIAAGLQPGLMPASWREIAIFVGGIAACAALRKTLWKKA